MYKSRMQCTSPRQGIEILFVSQMSTSSVGFHLHIHTVKVRLFFKTKAYNFLTALQQDTYFMTEIPVIRKTLYVLRRSAKKGIKTSQTCLRFISTVIQRICIITASEASVGNEGACCCGEKLLQI